MKQKTLGAIAAGSVLGLAGIVSTYQAGQEARETRETSNFLGDTIAYVQKLGDGTVKAVEYDLDTSYYSLEDGKLKRFSGDEQGLSQRSFGYSQQLPGYMNLFEQMSEREDIFQPRCAYGQNLNGQIGEDRGCVKWRHPLEVYE